MLGRTQEQVAEAVEKSTATVQRWEKGLRIPGVDDLKEIADYFRIRPYDLLRPPEGFPSIVSLEVRGFVQAGYWRETQEWPDFERYSTPMPDDSRFSGGQVFGLEVRGQSMNRVFPPGTILACANIFHSRASIPDDAVLVQGRYVIAEVFDHGLVETTVKQLAQDEGGKWWLWPRSTDPRYQTPLPLDIVDPETDSEVRVTAIVISSTTRHF